MGLSILLRSAAQGAVFFLATLLLTSNCLADDKAYGKRLVGAWDRSSTQLEKFSRFAPEARDPNRSLIDNVMMARTEDWSSPTLPVSSAENPYTIILRLKARAIASAPASSLWQVGWRDSNGARRMQPMAGLTHTDATAGDELDLTAQMAPHAVTRDQDLAVAIGLVNMQNMQLHGLRVEVWPGIREGASSRVRPTVGWLFAGLLVVLAWWFFLRPEHA